MPSTPEAVSASQRCLNQLVEALDPEATPPTQHEFIAWLWEQHPQPFEPAETAVGAVIDLCDYWYRQTVDEQPVPAEARVVVTGVDEGDGWSLTTNENGELKIEIAGLAIDQIDKAWRRSGDDWMYPHPLQRILRLWCSSQAQTVRVAAQQSGGILPLALANTPPHHRRLPILAQKYGSVSHIDGAQITQQLHLPGIDVEAPNTGVCLPLTLYYLGVHTEAERRGQAAPLALRLWMTGVLSLPVEERKLGKVNLHIKLRDLLTALYPGSRRPRPSEYLPKLEAAANALGSTEARVGWRDPETGKGGAWSVVTMLNMPKALDDEIVLHVAMPPGSKIGPAITSNLGHYGLVSAPKYRALINLAYRWFEPGRTHAPKRGKWLPKTSGHSPISDNELLGAFWPGQTFKGAIRRNSLKRAREHIAELQTDGELTINNTDNGLMVLPPKPQP